MSTLITSTEDIKAANSAVVHDLDFASIESYVEGVKQRYMLTTIGAETYTILGSGSARMAIAFATAKRAEANLAVADYINFGSVKLGESGAQVYKDNSSLPASDTKIAILAAQSALEGFRSLEALLAILDSDKATFTDYAQSDERKRNKALFINSTAEFERSVFIDNNATLFRSLRSYIRDAEREHIEPLLGDEYTEILRLHIVDGACTPIEQQLLINITDAVAPYAIAEAIAYRSIEIDANGVFTNIGGATGSSSIASRRLSSAMAAMVKKGENGVGRLRKFMVKNKDALAGSKEVLVDTRAKINDTDRGFLFF